MRYELPEQDPDTASVFARYRRMLADRHIAGIVDVLTAPLPATGAVSTLEPLLEHVRVKGYQGENLSLALQGIPIVIDETVSPGWLELRNRGGDALRRIRIA